MEYIRLAIVTDDRPYGEALARMLRMGNQCFDLSLFSCGSFCSRWQEKGDVFAGAFDLILWDREGADRLAGGNIVRLTEHVSETGSGRKEPVIFKYSPMEPMLGEIFRNYEAFTGRRPAGRRPARIDVFAFASWQGGSGCTSLCMELGREIIRSYRSRVLYLSLEGIESTPMYMQEQEGMRSAGEYLYHLGADEKARGPFLEGYLVKGDTGIRAFSPSGGCNPLSIASGEEMGRLMCAVMDSGQFDCILIDVGTAVGEGAREALAAADRILLVSSESEPVREEHYRRFLRYAVEGCEEENLLRVHNRGESGPEDGKIAEVRIRTARKDAAGLINEGGFAKDIHYMMELCYNKNSKSSQSNQ